MLGPASTKSSSINSLNRTLFVFAHQDDEYFALPWIYEELSEGAQLLCVYLTDGSRTAPAQVRDAESRAVLRDAGVPDSSIVFLETEIGRIPDQKLPEYALAAVNALERWMERNGFKPSRIYAPSYEGGHPDHDAAHMIAAVVSRKCGILSEAWHFSLYNGFECRRPFFATMHQLPTDEITRSTNLSFSMRWKMTNACWHYASQRRTWIGLFPGALYTRAIAGPERVVRFNLDRLRERPHEGELLYERMFNTSYEQFQNCTGPALALLFPIHGSSLRRT